MRQIGLDRAANIPLFTWAMIVNGYCVPDPIIVTDEEFAALQSERSEAATLARNFFPEWRWGDDFYLWGYRISTERLEQQRAHKQAEQAANPPGDEH